MTTIDSHATIPSPIGDLTVVLRDGTIVGLYFPRHRPRPDRSTFGRPDPKGAERLARELREYFEGRRRTFAAPRAAVGDDRQRRVWALIDRIPYGSTTTYGALAAELADGTTAQEVGEAVGRNPLSIIVPCHRVVGAGGRLTGYAGGLERKRFLLDLERDATERPHRLF
jgi:methylated-DNA-[protein]-cysteine S-methyltransferase